MSTYDEIKDRIARERRAEDLWCPHCKTQQDNDTKYKCVTYWGDSGSKCVNCSSCGHDFWVLEHVKRTFKSFKTNPDEEEEGYSGE